MGFAIVLLCVISYLLWTENPILSTSLLAFIFIYQACAQINDDFKMLYEICKGKDTVFNRKAKSENAKITIVLVLLPISFILFIFAADRTQNPVFSLLMIYSLFAMTLFPIGIAYIIIKSKYRRKGYDFCYDEVLLARSVRRKIKKREYSENHIERQKTTSAQLESRKREACPRHFDGDTGEQYEHYVALKLKYMGYSSVSVTQLSGDFGADIIAYNPQHKKTAIQCKKYSKSVGVDAVQQVVASKAHYGCSTAMVITTSTFTTAAKQLAHENNVVLMENFK